MKKTVFVCTFLLIGSLALAQETPTAELDPAQSGVDELELTTLDYGDGSKSLTKSAVSLRAYCPQPLNQRGLPVSSLPSLAFGYGAMTILQAKQNGWTGSRVQQEAFSAFFPFESLPKYNTTCQLRLREREGYIKALSDVLTRVGNVKASTDKKTTPDCNRPPTRQLTQEAGRYRIKTVERVFVVNDPTEQKKFRLKQSLRAGRPLVTVLGVDKSFFTVQGSTWKPDRGDPGKPIWQPVVVVGYDDNRQAVEIFNSLGSNWADRGVVWISYDDFFVVASDAVQLMPRPDETITPAPQGPVVRRNSTTILLRGSGSLEMVEAQADGRIQSRPLTVERQGNYYQTRQPVALESQLRFISRQLPRFGYVYIFSVDPNQKREVHFPLRGESAYVADDESQLVFPRPALLFDPDAGRTRLMEQGFKKNVSGTDWLVVLYSKQPISPTQLDGWLSELKAPSVSFIPTLERVLGSRMVPWRSAKFAAQAMQFTVPVSAQGDIVPLVVKIND